MRIRAYGQTFHEKPPQVASTHVKSLVFDATYGTWKPTSVNYNLAMVVIYCGKNHGFSQVCLCMEAGQH